MQLSRQDTSTSVLLHYIIPFACDALLTARIAIRAMQVMAQEQAAAAAAAAVQREAHKKRQVSKALEASRLRADRATRVAKLKVG